MKWADNNSKWIVTETARWDSNCATYGVFTKLNEAQSKLLELAHAAGVENLDSDDIDDNYYIDAPESHIFITHLTELSE